MSVPKISGLKPTGSQILIEILTSNELIGTNLTLTDKIDLKVPLQGYVKATGPSFNAESWGYNIGDRVLISGSGVMAPNYDNSPRDRFFMEPTAVKSVLVEQNESL